jgi:phage FluMu protein gp41
MITQKGTLPVGVEVDGVVHYDFEVRPQLVKDTIAAASNEQVANKGNTLFGLAIVREQVVAIGTLSNDRITLDMLLNMYEADMDVLMQGIKEVGEKLKTFRQPAVSELQATGSPA